MGKKISNPPPPDNVARPAPPPNPPRPPSWQDDIDKVRRLRDALVQKQTVIDEMLESLDEAKFTEPELRAKLDKQRHHIKRLKKEIDDFSDYRALKREQIARLQSQLADVASYESAALRKRIEQLEAAAKELINDDRACDCAECLIGESDAWVQLTALLTAGNSAPGSTGDPGS